MTKDKLENTTESPTPVETKVKKPRQRKATPKVESTKVDSPSNTLTTSQWLEDVKDINEYSRYLIDKKKDQYVNYNEVFSEVKIENLLTELYEHILYDIEQDTKFFNNDLIFNAYLNFLIIKYFTDMNDLLSGTLEENIKVVNKLREDNKFRVFFSDIFDNEQVMRVYERMNELTEKLAKFENMKEEQLKEILDNIQTPFLKENYTKQLEELQSQKVN